MGGYGIGKCPIKYRRIGRERVEVGGSVAVVAIQAEVIGSQGVYCYQKDIHVVTFLSASSEHSRRHYKPARFTTIYPRHARKP